MAVHTSEILITTSEKVMKRLIIVFAAIVLAAVGLSIFIYSRGPDLSHYDHIKSPHITTKAPQKVIVVEAIGDPDAVGEKAFGKLFELYYATDGVSNWPPPVPRARWPITGLAPRPTWIGQYALPVPDEVTRLPDHETVPDLKIALETWEYGEVAELLYTGPYDRETESIELLKQHIADQGYQESSAHEEEYLKGPGMFFRGNPETYVTIIRYTVKPVLSQSGDPMPDTSP